MTCYQYLNQRCPTCGKDITPYSYTIVDGIKYHIGCVKDV
jgi:hypothetical protein